MNCYLDAQAVQVVENAEGLFCELTEIEAEREFNQGLASGVVPSPVAAFACSRADAIAGYGEGGLGSRSRCVCGEPRVP